MLHGQPAGTTTELSAVDMSGLSEMGNILACCFINAFADADGLVASAEVPEISVDMCLPVIDSVLARFNQPGDKILLTEAVIYGGRLGKRRLPPAPLPGAGFAAQAHGHACRRVGGDCARYHHEAADASATAQDRGSMTEIP